MVAHRGNILVTGAGGFIAGHLVTYLKRQGYWVRGVDLKYPDFSSHDADDFLLLDLRRQEDCFEATRNIDEVYALASDTGGSGFLPLRRASSTYNNLLINLYTLEAARARRIKRYLYASSITANVARLSHASSSLIPADAAEALLLRQQTVALEQQLEERLCLHYGDDYNTETRVVRLPNVFGPRSAWEGGKERVLAALCRKIAQAKLTQTANVEIWGDGEQTRSFCYIDDCVSALHQAMFSSHRLSAIYGTYLPLTINQLADMIAKVAGIQIVKQYILGSAIPQRSIVQEAGIPQVVGMEPPTPLEQGLTTTYTWIEERLRTNLLNSPNP